MSGSDLVQRLETLAGQQDKQELVDILKPASRTKNDRKGLVFYVLELAAGDITPIALHNGILKFRKSPPDVLVNEMISRPEMRRAIVRVNKGEQTIYLHPKLWDLYCEAVDEKAAQAARMARAGLMPYYD